MKELFEWISKLDLSVIYTAIIGFATTWGGSVLALTIAFIKQRTKNFNYQKALETLKIELSEEQASKIDEMKNTLITELDKISKGLIAREDENAQARMEAINQITKDVEEANKELNAAFNSTDMIKELK